MDWGTLAQQRRGIVLHRAARPELLPLSARHPGSGRRLPAQVISDASVPIRTSAATLTPWRWVAGPRRHAADAAR